MLYLGANEALEQVITLMAKLLLFLDVLVCLVFSFKRRPDLQYELPYLGVNEVLEEVIILLAKLV